MDPTVLLIANILSLIGNVMATTSALFKSKRTILLFQSSNHVLEVICQFMTAAYSGMIQEVISLIRNTTFVFLKTTKKAPKLIVSLICLVAGIVLGVVINVRFSGNVLYGYLPIVAAATYSVFMILAFIATSEERRGELLLKIGLLINVMCWAAYGFFVRLYPVIVFNLITTVLSVLSIVRILSGKGKKDPLPAESAPPFEKEENGEEVDPTTEK